MKKRTVVVGGGIAGIVSALLLKQRGMQVTLIEKASNLGGLLSSTTNDQGDVFDHGTHLLSKTGIETLDHILFDQEFLKQVRTFSHERSGNFFSGFLNSRSPFIDLRKLNPDIYHRALQELLEITTLPKTSETLAEQLNTSFGSTITEYVFTPLLKKYFGDYPLNQLAPNSHLLFGLKRFIVSTPDETRKLKQATLLDECLAFHSYEDAPSTNSQFYPQQGGAGIWVDHLIERIRNAGVEIINNESVDQINVENHQITSVNLTNSHKVDCDLLVWTIPLFGYLKAAGQPLTSSPPKLRATSVFHFTVDQAPVRDVFYFWGHDLNTTPFRTTLYSNLNDVTNNRHRLTAEVLSEQPLNLDETSNNIFKEFKSMGIIPERTNLLFSSSHGVAGGFPVLTKDFIEKSKIQFEQAKALAVNALFFGKANGQVWFMNDVLRQVYNEVMDLPHVGG